MLRNEYVRKRESFRSICVELEAFLFILGNSISTVRSYPEGCIVRGLEFPRRAILEASVEIDLPKLPNLGRLGERMQKFHLKREDMMEAWEALPEEERRCLPPPITFATRLAEP